jgi:hypothetical protein
MAGEVWPYTRPASPGLNCRLWGSVSGITNKAQSQPRLAG